jgi:hypothetical protein
MKIYFELKNNKVFDDKEKGFLLECGKFVFYNISLFYAKKSSVYKDDDNSITWLHGVDYIRENEVFLEIEYRDVFNLDDTTFLELSKNKNIHIWKHDKNLMLATCDGDFKVLEKKYCYMIVL